MQTTSLASVGRVAPVLVGYYRDALAELGKLAAPSALSGDWNKILADIRLISAESARMGKFAADNDMAMTAKVELGIGRVQTHRSAIAKRDGFKDC